MWIEASTTSTIGYGAWHGNPLPAGKDTPNVQPLAQDANGIQNTKAVERAFASSG